MNPRGKKLEPKLGLDMPFAEALARFAATNPKEMHANIARAKQKKPPGGKKPSGGRVKSQSKARLGKKRKRPI